MKKTLLTIAAAIALTSLPTAYAAPQAQGEAKDASVHIKAPDGFRMRPQEFEDYAYPYHLSNDDTIQFSQRVAHYFAQVSGQKKTEMFAVAPGVFMTAAGTRVEFRDDGFTVLISNYERLPMAGVLPADTTVIAGR
jgi:hypothetical protein